MPAAGGARLLAKAPRLFLTWARWVASLQIAAAARAAQHPPATGPPARCHSTQLPPAVAQVLLDFDFSRAATGLASLEGAGASAVRSACKRSSA